MVAVEKGNGVAHLNIWHLAFQLQLPWFLFAVALSASQGA
jgi:hypothetical protein